MSQDEAKPKSSRACLGVAIGVIALFLFGCLLLIGGVLVVRHLFNTGALGSGGAPRATVSLRVLEDGCTVERGEVRGMDEVEGLLWVVDDAEGNRVLETGAENGLTWRYSGSGRFRVQVCAWYEGPYYPLSEAVWIECP